MALAAFLRDRRNVDLRLVDLMALEHPLGTVRRVVENFCPDVVGVSALSAESFMAHQVAQTAASVRPQSLVVLGGPYASSDPVGALEDFAIDVVVDGEGEESFLELVNLAADEGPRASAPENLRTVRGLHFRDEEGQVQSSPRRCAISDLDTLPLPAWDLIDVRRYWSRPGMSTVGIRPYLSLYTTRGCPYECVYCHNVFGKRFRARSAENVLDEIRFLSKRWGVDDFEVVDDIFNLNHRRMTDILEGLLREDRHPMLNFPNGVRTDILRPEEIELLRRVKPGEISVAVETASPRLQVMIKKNLDIDRVRQNIELLVQKGFFTRGFFMLGFPTETVEELRATIDLACRSSLHIAFFFAINPYKGTGMYDLFKAHGKECESSHGIDYEYFGAPFNGSELSDFHFRALNRWAYARFFLNPSRMARILERKPMLNDMTLRLRALLLGAMSFKRLREGAD